MSEYTSGKELIRFKEMNNKTLPFLLLLVGLSAFGQNKTEDYELIWGEEEKASRRETLSDIVGSDETGIYALKLRVGFYNLGQTLTLEHYDPQMNLTKSREIDLNKQIKGMGYEFIVDFNNKLYLFTSKHDNRSGRKILYYQQILKTSLNIDGNLIKVAEVDRRGLSQRHSGLFGVERSQDDSKLLIYYQQPKGKGGSDEFGFVVFDQSFKKLWDKRTKLPYDDEIFEVEDFEISNEGDVYLLGIVFKDKKKVKRKGEPNYQYRVLGYTDEGDRYEEYPVENEGYFFTDMQMEVTKEQNIICAGFYSEKGTFSIKGSYFIKLDAQTKSVLSEDFKQFDLDFITQNLTNAQVKKAKKGKKTELYSYRLDDIVIREDGGAVLVGEQFFVNTFTTTTRDANGFTQTVTTSYYHYDDIIVVNINPDGTIEWAEKIAKRQSTTNDGGFFSSYALGVVGSRLYFVFNDNGENLIYNGTGKPAYFDGYRNGIVSLVEVNGLGQQKRSALFRSREVDVLTRPKVCEQVSKNELVIFGQRKKTHRFAKILFK